MFDHNYTEPTKCDATKVGKIAQGINSLNDIRVALTIIDNLLRSLKIKISGPSAPTTTEALRETAVAPHVETMEELVSQAAKLSDRARHIQETLAKIVADL